MNRVNHDNRPACGFFGYFFVCDFNTALTRYYHLFSLLLQYARRFIYTMATSENGKSDVISAIIVIVTGNEGVDSSDFYKQLLKN